MSVGYFIFYVQDINISRDIESPDVLFPRMKMKEICYAVKAILHFWVLIHCQMWNLDS